MAGLVGNHPGWALVQTMREHGHDHAPQLEGREKVPASGRVAVGLSRGASGGLAYASGEGILRAQA